MQLTQQNATQHLDGLGRIVVGLILIAIFWTIAWTGITPISEHSFFPLWFGYVLVVDGLCSFRGARSLMERSGARWLLLFLLSIPIWWLFELINQRLENWHYLGTEGVGAIEYAIRASISFSIVVPAILTTSELVTSFRLRLLERLPAIMFDLSTLIIIHLVGWLLLALMLIWPTYFFPFCWISIFLILDPILNRLGGLSLSRFIAQGDWSAVQNLALGALICGFFWEMWNIYSMPKWQYSVPFVDLLHIFEMPLLGYGGYIPFGFEIYTFVALAQQILPRLKLPQPQVSSRGTEATSTA